MCAGDVRKREPIAQILLPVVRESLEANLVAGVGGLLEETDQIGVRAVKREPSPVVRLLEEARFKQNAIGERGRPIRCHEMMRPPPSVVDSRAHRRAYERWALALPFFRKGARNLVLRIR